ncbi:hypothetical protein HNR46_003565, partial [Haloferula luteola]
MPRVYSTEKVVQDGSTVVSRTLETFLETGAGFQRVTSESFPDPSASQGLVTEYRYYPSTAGDQADKLWWTSRPDGSWTVHQYGTTGNSVTFTPFQSEVLLNPQHSDPNTLPLLANAGFSSARIKVRFENGEEVLRPLSASGNSQDIVFHEAFSGASSNEFPVENTAGDDIPSGIDLMGTNGRIYYANQQDPANQWLAGRTLLEYDDEGRGTRFQYSRNAYSHIVTKRTTGAVTMGTGTIPPPPGLADFHEVDGLSERTVIVHAPEGVMSRETLYKVAGAGFVSAQTESYEYFNGHYHRTLIEGIEVHRIDRPDPYTLVETDAQGNVTTSFYNTKGQLLWSEKSAGGGVPAVRTTSTRVGLTTTVDVNGIMTSETVVDGLGRVISRKDATGAVTTVSYPNGGRDTLTTLPGGVQQYEERYLDGSLRSHSGTGWVNAFYSTSTIGDESNPLYVEWGHQEVESTGSASAHTLRSTTRVYGTDGKLTATLKPSPANAARKVRENSLYQGEFRYGSMLEEIDASGNSTGIYAQRYFYESSSPFGDDVRLLGGLSYSGLDLDATEGLQEGSTDRITKIEMAYVSESGVVYRRTRSYTYPDPSGADPNMPDSLMSESKVSVSFIPAGAGKYATINITTDPAGRTVTTTTTIHPEARRVEVVVNDSATTPAADSITTSVNGYVVSVQQAGAANATAYQYDALGRVSRYIDGRNASTYSFYYSHAQLDRVTDHLGGTTSYSYYQANEKNAGKVKTITRPGGLTETTSYNDRGQTTLVEGSGVYERLYGYDAYGDMISMETYGSQAATTYWVYQARTGLLEKKRYHGTEVSSYDLSYLYEPDGKLKQRITKGGVVTEYVYAPLTRDLTNINYSGEGNLTPDVTFSNFDGFGRPRQVSESRIGGTGAVGTGSGAGTAAYTTTQTLSYQPYSGAVSTTYASNHRWLPDVKVAHDPDQNGRPMGWDLWVGTTTVATQSYGYDSLSRLQTISSPDLSAALVPLAGTDTLQQVSVTLGGNLIHQRSLTVDLLGRTEGVTNKAGASVNQLLTVASMGHDYDAAGRRELTRREDGTWWTYGYNARSEVTAAAKHFTTSALVPGLEFSYSYDGMGNRTSSSAGSGSGMAIRGFTPNALNQYSTLTNNAKL